MSGRLLVQAAAELITEKGWEATTAAEIGRRAGYSRAMVHARFGSKDALLETLFRDEYIRRFSPSPEHGVSGLRFALAHFDRILELYREDRDFLRAMFVMTFEAVKTTSPVRRPMQTWLTRGAESVRLGLENGIRDGSVRPDIDLDRAVSDISAAVFGIAYQWVALAGDYHLDRELEYVRAGIAARYGTTA